MPQPLDLLCLLIILLGPAPWCVGLATRQAAVPLPRTAVLLVLLVSWCVLQTAIALVLGSLGAFRLRGLVTADAGLFLAGLPLIGRSAAPTLRSVSALPRTWTERTLVLGTAVAGTSLLLRLAATPITDYDSLAYHLPVMAKWYQTHAFVMLDQFYEGRLQVSRYPYGWEALSTLFLLPFGEDVLVALPNLMAWLVFGLATHVVAVRLGARPLPALVFTFLLLTSPIVREHVTTMHVDLALGAFFMAGLAFALGSARDPINAALFAAALGILAGTKTSGLVYAACLAATFAWTWLTEARAERSDSLGWRSALLAGAAALGGALAGLFWYARNFVETGNPLGSVRVAVGGILLFPGPLDQSRIASTTLWTQFRGTNLAHWAVLLAAVREQLGLMFLVSLLGACGLRFFRRPRGRVMRRDHFLMFMGLLIASALAYWTTPASARNWDLAPITPWIGQALRYAFPLIGLLAVAGALALSGAQLPDEIVVPAVVGAGLMGMSSRMMPVAAIVLLLVWGVHRTLMRARARTTSRIVAACALSVLLVAVSHSLRSTRAAARTRAYHGLVDFIDRNVGSDEVIGYVLSHQSYLFYGSHFDRDVLYVPARADQRAEWIAGLRTRHVRFLALGPIRPEWRQRKEFAWVRDGDGVFTRIFGRDQSMEPVFYRVNYP